MAYTEYSVYSSKHYICSLPLSCGSYSCFKVLQYVTASNISAYITALMGHSLGELHFRRIGQGGVLRLALIVALLVVNLWDHTEL